MMQIYPSGMIKNFVRAGLLLTTAPLVACGGGDGDSSGLSAEQALADQDCYTDLSPDGRTYESQACSGTSQSAIFAALEQGDGFEATYRVGIDLAAPPVEGMLDVSTLTVTLVDGADEVSWESTSCTGASVGTSVDEDLGWVYHHIELSCPDAAVPVGDNTGDPMELGDFALVVFFSE